MKKVPRLGRFLFAGFLLGFALIFFKAGWAEGAVFDFGFAIVDENVWAFGD